MTTRVTQREIVRDEVQDLFHKCFTLTAALQRRMETIKGGDAKSVEPDLENLEHMLGRLNEVEEALRARVLPILG
ncbi:MAG TPA: hypothetical protein VI818_00380 [Candidatus Thermoplasmatota archaeon]|nr:hypothetical protein [Candidatus Thermoplasmatota archaeon]